MAFAALLGAAIPALGEEVEARRLQETHYRSERGLRCYLEKKCSKPSSYMYDAEIAAAVRARFAASTALRDASLWVTAQRRFVWVEGCVGSRDGQRRIEKLLEDVPDPERLIVFVWNGRAGAAPYRTLKPGQRRED
ncbi:MAG TPA: BON domain-containing protein [Usitatibacter sp.]|nr:BON domain-containing protein [Usitatibacter sp.]